MVAKKKKNLTQRFKNIKKNHQKTSRIRGKKTRYTKSKKKLTVRSQLKLVLEMLREFKWPTTERNNILRTGQSNYEGFVLGKVISWAGKGENAGYKKI